MLSFLEGARGSPAPAAGDALGEVLGRMVEAEVEEVFGVLESAENVGDTLWASGVVDLWEAGDGCVEAPGEYDGDGSTESLAVLKPNSRATST